MKNPDRIVIEASTTPAAPARRALKRRAPAPLVLEQRIMFDGAAVDTAAGARAAAAEHAAADGAAAERAAAEKAAAEVKVPAAVAPAAGEQPRHEIVFIEDNVANLQQLVAGVRDGVEVVVLDHTRDGLQQMLDALKGHAPVDAIHLVTHGSSGQIELGSTISGANIEQYRDQFAQLGQSLTANGDLLIYGCDVAEGAAGQAFVDRLADLTQADVAASVDVTGSAAFHGNWTLETQHGAIETAALALDRAGWQGELAIDTVYDANWQQLVFNGADSTGLTPIIGNGRNTGDVMRFNSVITINGQAVDAVVTTTLDRATLSSTGYDSTAQPSTNNAYFQPNMVVAASGGGVTFTIDFYKAGTYTGAGTGTAVTLQNVAVNSYDIDGVGSSNSDRQYQQFKGFARYELSNNTKLVPVTQGDGSVTFQYVSTTGVNNGPIAQDEYRVKVYYDSMSSFQIKSGVNTSGSGSLNGTAYFALDFSIGPAWATATTIVDSPAARLTYSTTNFTEAAANDGSFTMTSTITLANGSFSGSDGTALSGVTFSNTPAGLTAEITRTSATTATLKFTGNASAHANANDISNFGVSFGNGAFSGVLASAVTGAARADIVVDFADPVNRAPTASSTSIVLAEDTVKSGSLPAATDLDGDTITYTKATDPAHGTIVVNANGTYTYTPAANYNGVDSFNYSVGDGRGGSNTYTVSILVNGVNDAPTASNTSFTTNEDTVKSGSLPAATDVDGDAITYGKGSDPAHGTVVVNANGTYTYTPAANYNGSDSFNYTVSDGNGGSNTYTISITVSPVNDAPTASGTAITTAEDTVKSGSLPAATDVDGDTVTYGKGSDPAHGTVVVNANGTYTYTPAANYNGSDSFTYTVSDGNGGSNTYTVAVTVSPVNDAPTASGTAITTAEDTVKSGSLPAATDVDGDTVTYGKGSDPAHGTVVVNANGTYTYTPAANYNGSDSFTYTVSDGNGGSNTYTVAVTVSPVNDAPTASGTAITTAEDTVKSGSLPAATDVDGDTVTYGKGSDPAHGTVVVNGNGTYTYTPAANYNGSDSFTYTVSDGNGGSNTYTVAVTVSPVNDAPTASGTTITTAEDTVKSGSLPAATDVDGDTVTYGKGSDPAHGTVVVNANGTYTYTPAANYNGSDSFTYTVSDGNGGSNTYTVAVTVSPVNDAPTASATSITTAEDTVKAGSLPAATDVDGDAITYSKASNPAHGTVVVNSDGTYTYTPAANYNGSDSFTYTVSDGNGGSNTYTVAVTVSPVNDAPTASGTAITTAEDTVKSGSLPAATDVDGDTVTYGKGSDPAHGTVVVNANGTYTYTPVANYNGADSFTYTVSDGNGGSNTYTVAITVSPVNDAPTASGTAITTAEDTTKSGSLPAATDVDGDTVTYGKGSDPAHGTVVVNSDGTYTYTPAANYNGSDSFTYTVSDSNGGSNTYTISITVSPVNDAPVAGNDAIITAEDTVKTGTLPAATDVDGDTVTYGKGSNPAHGVVTINADGTYTYAPAANYYGADSFTYTVSDGKGGSNTYTVSVIVTPVNDAPTASDMSITTNEDTAKSGNLPSPTDFDIDVVVFTKGSDPAHGTATVSAVGSYTYVPAANYNGPDSFTYVIEDGKGGKNTYTVSITVNPVNDAPTASGTLITTSEDTVKNGTLPTATDIDGDMVTYAKATDPAHGALVISANGTYTYTPAANYNGADSFTYTVNDGKGGANTYTVAIMVSPVNDAPTASGTAITTNEDTIKTGTLPAAIDIDGDTVTYGKGSDPTHGTVVVSANGTYTYTPASNYNGADSFTYTVSDGKGGSNTYTVAITVSPVNDAPIASGAAITTSEDTVKAGTLPAASDVEGDAVTYVKASNPSHGTVEVNANGSYTYTPTASYNGADSFTYTVSDGKGGSNTYTVSITVRPAVTLSEDTVKTGNLPAATDVDGDAVNYAKASDPSHGAVVVNADGSYTYTPVANYNGTDSFSYTLSDGKGRSNTYTVAIIVNPVNDAPTASGTAITTTEDTDKTGTLPPATDIDGDTVTYGKASDPEHGTVEVKANGTYTYKPAANYHGADSFTYTVSDGKGGSNSYEVKITVSPVNDAPTAAGTTITTAEDNAKAGALPAATDIDGDTVTYAKASDPAHGAVVVNADGTYTYTPAANYHGTDSFTYTVSDGNGGSNTYTVGITVSPAITLNEDTVKAGNLPAATDMTGDTVTYSKASDPVHGAVEVNANGTYSYAPTANYNGADSFTYTVSDGKGRSNTYTVAIIVNPVNDVPTASDTAITTAEDTDKTGTLPPATDIDGDTVTYGKASDPEHGTVEVKDNGTYTYKPAANYHGADSFTYTVSDGKGGSNTYEVKITVSPVNDAPTAAGTTITTAEDNAKAGALPAATDIDGDTVTYAKASDPANGAVVVNADGTYTYTPSANYHGADSFTYTVSDGNGGSNTYTVGITVSPAITLNEDTVKAGNLPAATDMTGDTVTYSKASDPVHGAVEVNANGTYTYTPVANFHGADSFTYTVSDGKGGSNTYTVAIKVIPVNDAPTASGTAITTAEDTDKTGTLPAATDVDGDTVTYGKASDPEHGTVEVKANGTYTYKPAENYNGDDKFTYTVSDGNGGSNTYTVTVKVEPVNDAPTASGTGITTDEDKAISGSLPAALDVDGDTVSYGKGSDPARGTVEVNADGTYTYTPVANFHGDDSFTYTVSDGKGGSNTYTVAITVAPVNDAPVAGNDAVTLDEDTVKTGTLPVASDVDGDAVTYGKATDPAHGAVVVNADGSYTYTPAANYNGADSFTYTVSDGKGGSNTYTVAITVTPVNDAPVGSGTSITTAEDTVKTGTLPVATDVDGDTLTYGKGSDPAHGTVTVNPDGSYVYTPAANYNGADSFIYTVNDGKGGSNTYTVAITISPVNDAPVGSGTSITTAEDTVKTGTLPVATDVDGDTLTYGKGSDPAHGTVTVNPDGSYVYTPAANYNGADSFTYTVNDGKGGSNTYTVAITISPVNDAPVGSGTTITTNEDTVKTGTLPVALDVDGDTLTYGKGSDPAHGTVTVNPDGSYVYTPAANYNGADSFTYTVNDGKGGSNTYTVAITISPVNDAPVGSGTAISTSEDTVKTGTLPVATDVDGDTLTYGKGSDPAHGTVTVNPDGTYVYTPAANYNGADSFTYTVNDGKGGSNTYTVAITISPVNDAPVGSGTTITTAEDTLKTGTLPVALDVDGDTLTYGKGSDPTHGTVTVNPDGTYVYTPAANYNGADSFTYTVNDGKGGSNTYTVAINITAVNDAPVGSGTTITTNEDTVKTGTLPVALDADGDTLTYGKGSDPAHGTVVVNPDGTYVYTPAANYNGLDSFTYTVSDGKGGSNTYTVNIAITAVNDAPTASNATVAVDEDAVLSGSLPAVVDVDGDSATYAKAGDPAHGTVTVNADGSYVYTPAANYNGADSFSYTVSDGKGGSTTYTVNITVNPVNDAPVAPGGVPTPADLSAGVAMPALTVPAFTDIDSASLNYTATLANGGALPAWLVFDPATRTFSGTPASDAAGSYTVIVRASDGTASSSVAVNFTVLPLPQPPVIAPEPVTVPAPVVVEAPPAPAPLPVATLPPLPVFVPTPDIVDTRINAAAPLNMAGSDATIQLDGRGIRAADLSNGEYRRAAEMSDLYTDNNGFRTVVAKAENPALMLFQGVPDQYTESGRALVMTIPSDAFVHTQADAVVRLAATLQDGRPLPSWVQFDAQTGKFTGDVPKGLVGELRIKLTARDINGHEATALFRINVGQAKNAMGKSGLSEQLRQASAVNAAYRARA